MNAKRWTTTLTLLGLCAVPAAGQQPAGMSPHGAQMHPGMMQPCQAMSAGVMGQGGMGAMHGRAGMMGTATMRMAPGMMGSAGMVGSAGMMGPMGPMGPMGLMQGGRPDANALLGAAGSLGLTSAQQDRLTAIAETEHQDRQERIGRGHGRLPAGERDPAGGRSRRDRPTSEPSRRRPTTWCRCRSRPYARGRRRPGSSRPQQRTRLQDSMALVGSMLCGELGGAAGAAPGPGGPTSSR